MGGYRISPGLLTFLVGMLLLLIAGVLYQQSLASSGQLRVPAAGSTVAATGSNVKYVCPMRCVELDEPGTCPVCGMDTTPVEIGPAAAAAGSASGEQLYTCPMHPQIIQDRPGTCPICGMELVPKSDPATDDSGLDLAALEGVQLSPTQEVLANVTPVQPERENMALTVPAIGEVTIPQDQMREVVAWQDGRVDNLVLDQTGGYVKEGQHIMDMYSEELVQAQNEYLIALKAADQLGDSGYESIASSTRSLLEASRTRLIREGMTPEQLTELEQSRQVQDRVPIYAKEGGVVMDKRVSEGMYVARGEALFTVADLSPVWVEVQVFERDAANVKVGDRVKLKSPTTPGKTYTGRVQLIEPELEMDTRTYKLRVQVDNPGLSLRPGMIMDAEISFDYGNLLLLPRNAVLHTGDGDLVYVRTADGNWTPRKVTIGRDFGDRVEISAGLKPGETVAGTAVFLLDSEAQLKGVPRPIED
jgi:membrane fusion protein, copper/silver efflux system